MLGTDALARSRTLLTQLFGAPGARPFRVRYWEGTVEGPDAPGAVEFTLLLNDPGALRAMLLPPTERSVGEAYLGDLCDVEGDMEAAVAEVAPVLGELLTPGRLARLLPRLLRLPRPGTSATPAEPRAEAAGSNVGRAPDRRGAKHSPDRDRRSIRHHYDRGNDFYRLFLDPWMQYSCGRFRDGARTLEEAQEAKLELMCERLELGPGRRMLDIGCGWGGLIRYAASRHGVQATGLTLSGKQAEAAREAFRADGLEDRCRVEVRDYRELPDPEPYDSVVSVGMVEHVGHRNLGTYYEKAFEALRPGGLFLNQGIVTLDDAWPPLRRLGERLFHRWTSFIEEHVFPDGELVTGAERIRPAEAAGFETRLVDSFREDYAETCRRWVQRLEARRDEAMELAGERTYRVWRAYMAGSALRFDQGSIGLLQELYRKP